MKTIEEMTSDILRKARIEKRKHRIVRSSVALSLAAVTLFAVGYSNIITVDISPYENSYKNYLSAYANAAAGVRIVGKNSAVVHLNGEAYPCALKATGKTTFSLKNNAESQTSPTGFQLSCTKASATLSWQENGEKKSQNLPVATQTADAVPEGLWSLFAIGDSLDFESASPVSGAGWTMVFEDGTSYTAEGASAVYPSRFVDVNGTLFQCLFDAQSGVMLDASAVILDTESFSYPVLIERYLSDGDPAYFYSKQLSESELIDFSGGEFSAAGVTVAKQNQITAKDEILGTQEPKWQLLPNEDMKNSIIDASAKLALREDGGANLTVTGGSAYAGNASGKWYPLKDSVLVVLDERSPLLGKAFTVYADGDDFEKTAKTYCEQYDFYRVGYHEFFYFLEQTDIQVFWGSAWEKEHLLPRLIYETAYVLDGVYFADYYDDPDFDPETHSERLAPLPENGTISLIFHEDGTMDIVTEHGTTTTAYELIEHDKTLGLFIVEFDDIEVHDGISLHMLNVGSGGLFMYSGGSVMHEGKRYDYTFYETTFRLTVA